jgi:hypothetical protein
MAWEEAIPIALSAVSTASSVGGKLKGGQANSQADYYKAQVAENNAIAYDQMATRVVQGGEVASDVAGLRTAAAVGDTKAKQSANGIDVNTGSAVDVRAGVAQAGRINQLTTLSNAQLQGYGYRVKAAQERAQAQLDRAGGAGATQGAALDAAGSIFGAASKLPFGWLNGGGGDSGSGSPNDPSSNPGAYDVTGGGAGVPQVT